MLDPDLLQRFGEAVPVAGLLGYLNFSEGRSDPRFRKQVNDAYALLATSGVERPSEALPEALAAHLTRLRDRGSAAFKDTSQAEAVLRLALVELPAAYRAFHADLLFHQSDADLLQPYFLAVCCETVLAQRGPWDETSRVIDGALRQLNDYVGHRPVAVLESRPRGEPYDHEKVRPIPLYFRGAGVAWGRYQELLAAALQILEATSPATLAEASFDPAQLDEWALDPRGYDFDHPADKRPNYCFGEWDPHHIDNHGRFRRYVARQVTVDGLLARVNEAGDVPREERLLEAAAVLAGTVLMAAGVSGWGPGAHDSSVNLATLVPRIAKYREAFYAQLLQRVSGAHGERLRREEKTTRQPFGLARRALNNHLARHRALQLQERHLALLLAEIGYPEASRRQLAGLPVASARMLTEIQISLTTGRARVARGQLDEAARLVAQVEDLVKRGIECGALADPWNVLGFQGQYPRFQSLEDSVRDTRIDALVGSVGQLFELYAGLLAEGAARGTFAPDRPLARDVRRLAEWWDRFATTTVSDIPHVNGGEAVKSAEHVARSLAQWHERGSAAADIAFWRGQVEGFRTPEAFALVTAALLERRDYRAALALLITWLGQADEVPLAEGEHSFHDLSLRWLLGVCSAGDPAAVELATRFFDYAEANAEEYWQVPRLDPLGTGADEPPPEQDEDEDDVYGAAYEGVTYQDSTDDDNESEVLDVMPRKDFDLAHEAERLEPRLRFLGTVARLWNVATRAVHAAPPEKQAQVCQAAAGWLAQARTHQDELLRLTDRIHEHAIPKPSGAYEAMVEYDRRVVKKTQLLQLAVATCLDHALAVGALRGVVETTAAVGEGWESIILELERSLIAGDTTRTREVLPRFIAAFRAEPLLYTPLNQGGHPRAILRSSLARLVLRSLVHNLPRQGLLRETYQLLRLARAMEAGQDTSGPRVTEFDQFYQTGLQAVTEAVARAAKREGVEPVALAEALEAMIEPFLVTWLDHAGSLRVSSLELIATDKDWLKLKDFIKRFGRDLFTARFLALGNLRGIVSRGVGAWLNHLRDEPDPLHPVKLADELDHTIPRAEAERHLHVILHALLENYDHLRDYNATTSQSDYGDNLYQLVDFLRLKAGYDRTAWQLKPMAFIHDVLARHDGAAAAHWRDQVRRFSAESADGYLQRLARLERDYGVRLTTVRDRLEERFARPLELDRLCAMIPQALDHARETLDRPDEPCPLEAELAPFAETPTGVGLDVPPWLARLEGELRRVRGQRSGVAALAEAMSRVPKLDVPFADLAGQLQDWRQLTLDE